MARTTGKAVMNWQEELEKDAKAVAATEATVALGNWLSVRNGRLSYKGNTLTKDNVDVVVLDHCLENVYYEDKFNPDNPASPVCFAFGYKEDDMKPHASSSKPQHATCKGCPNNEFGSADTGKGKACKNSRRLGLMMASDVEKNLADADVAYLRLPVTSVKAWAGYVMKAAANKYPPYSIVTNIKVEPDPKSQFKLSFNSVEPIDMSKHFAELKKKRGEVIESIQFPYTSVEARKVEAPKKRKY